MDRFWNPENIAPKVLAPGVTAKIASGEKMMLSLVTLSPNAVVPTHSHPHEQMGMMVSGTLEYTIAGETRVLSGGGRFFVPGGGPHAGKGGPRGVWGEPAPREKSAPLERTPPRAPPIASCPDVTAFRPKSINSKFRPTIRSMHLYAASIGPFPVAASSLTSLFRCTLSAA